MSYIVEKKKQRRKVYYALPWRLGLFLCGFARITKDVKKISRKVFREFRIQTNVEITMFLDKAAHNKDH